MKRYEVLLSETARRQLNGIPPDLRSIVRGKLSELHEDPFRSRPNADIKKLKGPKKDYYRLRAGNYRAIYIIEEYNVKVAKILPRDRAYDWIE